MSIRHLSQSDAAEYRSLMLEAYKLHPDAFTSSYSEREVLPLAWWESRLKHGENPSELVLGAFHENGIAGVAGLSFESREKARHKATLFGMYVLPRYRRLGFAHQLVQAVLSEAKARPSVKLVQLTVTHGNHGARSLYERSGFVEFGLEPHAVSVGDGFVSKVHMWCDLRGLPG